jgi:2-polyprenyl-3-methyl-5-hydroxy-6-metoxy-1,4-benzoquinol methylase
MKNFSRQVLQAIVSPLGNLLNYLNYTSFSRKTLNERPLEYAFAFQCLSEIYPQNALDVGPGKSPWPAIMAQCGIKVVAIDEMQGYWLGRLYNQHYYVVQDNITHPNIKEEFDLITCLSVLEHIPEHGAAIKSMFKLLRPGGYLVLSFPYNDSQYFEDIYRTAEAGYGKNAPYVCQVFNSNKIQDWLGENNGELVKQEFYKVFTGEFWTYGDRLSKPYKVEKTEQHHLTCVLLKKL